MRRSAPVVLFSLFILGCLTSAVTSAAAAEKQPPNIVFIIADDKNYDFVECGFVLLN